MKVSDQMKVVQLHAGVSQHSLFNAMAMLIQQKFEDAIPGLDMQFGGKSVKNGVISATLSGAVANEGDVDEKVRYVIGLLQNPTAFDSLV